MLEPALNYLQTEWRVIKDAPVAFALCVLVGSGVFLIIAWWFMGLRYQDRLDALKEQVELEKSRAQAAIDTNADGLLEVGLAMPQPGSPHFVLRNTGDKTIKYAVEDMLVIKDEKVIPHELKEVRGRITAGGKKDIWTEPRLKLIENKDEYYIDLHITVRYGLENEAYSQLTRNRRLCRILNGVGECKILLEKDYSIASKE